MTCYFCGNENTNATLKKITEEKEIAISVCKHCAERYSAF